MRGWHGFLTRQVFWITVRASKAEECRRRDNWDGFITTPKIWPVGICQAHSRFTRGNMWSDNESSIDLLGFQHLAGAVTGIVRRPHLLPGTVGIFGDWGSGKSSLLRIVE